MTKKQKQSLIKKLEKDVELYKGLGREYRARGIQDAYHFYRGKANECELMIYRIINDYS
jgi:alpha/beta superfamily hydrolase